MLMKLRSLAIAACVLSVGMGGTANAQLTFSIDPTQGLPGITVSGQVDPAQVAAQCVTTVEGIQAEFQAVLDGPYGGGGTGGELFLRFFPFMCPNEDLAGRSLEDQSSGTTIFCSYGNGFSCIYNETTGDLQTDNDGGNCPANAVADFVFDTCDQAAYSLTGITVLAIGSNILMAAETTLPQTFVMTFADLATQQPLGELGHFDPVTGVGSVVVPNLAPGQWPIVATCAVPTLDLDRLEAGIRANGAFLESLGFPTCDINDPAFADFVKELLGPDADLFTFLSTFGPTFIQAIVVPGPLGLQFFTILDQPSTKDECKNGGWQQFNEPPPGLGFRNQGDCVAFFNAGLHAGTTAAVTN
jgi:hypothetical protein